MSFLDSYFRYLNDAFVEHKYLLIFTILFGVFCWIGGYFLADWIYTPAELVDYEELMEKVEEVEYVAMAARQQNDKKPEQIKRFGNNLFPNLFSFISAENWF